MSTALVVELLVKSGLIAGAGLALAWILRFRPAADRVDILRVTVCLLIVLPLVIALAPGLSLALLPPVESAAALPVSPVAWAGAVEPVEGVALSGSILWPTTGDLVLWAWAAGAVLVLGRFVLGVWTLQRWTRKGRTVTAAAWTGSLERLAPARRPRLVSSPAVGAPLSWGAPPGVVLIGPEQLARPETARAVLAHELAHLQRGDWFFLVLSRVALGLFWFNPLVWKLHAALSAQSEEAADAVAVGKVDRRTYARALVDLASDFNPPAALGMAGPAETLTRRIVCIMKTSVPLRRRPLAMAVAVGALIGVATPIAALELTSAAPAPAPAVAEAPVAPLAAARIDAVGPVEASAPAAPVRDVEAVAEVASVAPVASDGDWFTGQDAYAPPPPPPVPPLPPAPPAPPAPYAARVVPPAPPAPPAPPVASARAPRAIGWVHGNRPLTEQERQAVVEARQTAVEARLQAREARRLAMEARVQARAAAAAAPEARARARAAMAQAAEARAQAGMAREHAAREVANSRVHMARGADQMVAGAEQMREQSARLRDPAYRAEQIERARERGETVTDAELQALAPRLATQADQLERRAVEMRERAARQPS